MIWNAAAVPAKLPCTLVGKPMRSMAFFTPVTASLSALPGAMSNDTVMAGIWPAWLMKGGIVRRLIWVTAVSGTIAPPVPGQIKPRQGGGIELVLRQQLQHHLVLVGGGVDLRHLLAAKCQAQGALDFIRRHAQRCRPSSVDGHPHRGRHLVLVAVDAHEGGIVLHRAHQIDQMPVAVPAGPGPARCIDSWSAIPARPCG